MNYTDKTKAELKALCDQRGLSYSKKDTNAKLIELLESREESASIEKEAVRAEVVVEELSQEEVEELVESKEAEIPKEAIADGVVKVEYKVKQRWLDLGEFDSKESALKMISRKGIKEYNIL